MTYNVLIVEDNLDQLELIRIALKRASKKFETQFAASGGEAMKMCAKNAFDTIVLDYKLPDISGVEVLNRLREQDINTPVIIVTGQGDEKIAVEAMKTGAADYLVKEDNYLSTLPKIIASVIERDRLQQKLREKEDFLANVVENANDIIFSLDQNFNFQFINPRIRKLEYQPEELTGHSFFEVLSDKYTVQTTTEILRKPEERNYEMEFVDKKGEIHPQIISFNFLARNGRNGGHLLGIAKDMTKTLQMHRLIQESKNKLQTLFDSITDHIIVLDKDKNIIIANKKVACLKNTTPDRIVGQKCYTLYADGSGPCTECVADRTWESKRPEFLERRKDGRILQMWSYPMFDLDSNLEYVIEYSRDVTEQKVFERQLIQSEKLATIGLLASGVAHELRNPLNIIEAARYYLQDTMNSGDANLTAKLQIIKRNVQRASNIINNLLDFSRHSPNDFAKLNVNEIIDKTLSLIEKDLRSQNIAVFKNYHDIPNIHSAVDSIKQVFLNIIINAIHAMPRGGELSISTQSVDDEWIMIRFSDTGIGIAEENLKNVFSPFFTTKALGKGTGLGMYISHSMIEKEGGDIFVESEEGKGTTFIVMVPMHKKEPAAKV